MSWRIGRSGTTALVVVGLLGAGGVGFAAGSLTAADGDGTERAVVVPPAALANTEQCEPQRFELVAC